MQEQVNNGLACYLLGSYVFSFIVLFWFVSKTNKSRLDETKSSRWDDFIGSLLAASFGLVIWPVLVLLLIKAIWFTDKPEDKNNAGTN